MNDFWNRIVRAIRLDPNLYEEVEADTGAMGQAMGVVVLASLAAGIGMANHAGTGGLVSGTLTALFAWFVWSFITYLIPVVSLALGVAFRDDHVQAWALVGVALVIAGAILASRAQNVSRREPARSR